MAHALTGRRGAWSLRLHAGVRLALVQAVSVLALLFAHATASAQQGSSIEEVEAAYLHRFAGYIEWPPQAFPSAQAPFVVGVAGSEKVYAELARLSSGRPVQGRPVQVRRLLRPQEVAAVHLAFIGPEAWSVVPAWLNAAEGLPVAVVTDAPRGSDLGALLTFVNVDNRLRFEASMPAAERAGLQLSSRLLAVAKRVVGGPP